MGGSGGGLVRTEAEFDGGHPAGAYNIPVRLRGAAGLVPNEAWRAWGLHGARRCLLRHSRPQLGHYGRLVAATLPGHAPGQRAQEQQVGKHRERDGAAPAWGWGGSELIAIVVGVHAAQKCGSVGRLSRLA